MAMLGVDRYGLAGQNGLQCTTCSPCSVNRVRRTKSLVYKTNCSTCAKLYSDPATKNETPTAKQTRKRNRHHARASRIAEKRFAALQPRTDKGQNTYHGCHFFPDQPDKVSLNRTSLYTIVGVSYFYH